MTNTELSTLFTNKVRGYMNNGYIINTKTFSGCDGTQRVDLIKGNHFIRVYLESYYDGESCIALRIGEKILTPIEMKRADIIWKKDLNIIKEYVFIKIGRRNDYYVTKKEYEKIEEKIKERLMNGYRNYEIFDLNDKAIDIVMSFIKRQPKCKSVKRNEIKRVYKQIYDNGRVKYLIYVRGNVYTLS